MVSSDSESDWSDIEEDHKPDETDDEALCLFCKDLFGSIDGCFDHIEESHDVNIKAIILKLHLDFYGYIKFVNYLRKTNVDSTSVKKLTKQLFVDDDALLQPIIEGDMMLQFDVDSLIEGIETETQFNGDEHENKLSIAEGRAKLAEEFLERTLADLNTCRNELKTLLLSGVTSSSTIATLSTEEDENNRGYFSSYAHYGIHEEMLKDKVRTEAYRSFICNNPAIFKDAIVLDVGCGTSILSMFSAQAGAKKVIAVDNSEVAYQAMDIIKENNLDSVISILKGKAEDVEIKVKVDVIISEWMGYFLLFESMLDTVIYCRDRYLAENGHIYPDKCNIQLAALADDEFYSNKVKFWADVYGFKMSTMKSSVVDEPLIDIVNNKKIISEGAIVKEFDLMKISIPDLDFDAIFQLKITKDGLCSAIVGYFDIMFEGNSIENPVTFSTSPDSIPTHWKQTIFLLKEPIECKSGDIINGHIFCKKNKHDLRALDVALIFYNDEKDVRLRQHYVIS